MSFMRTLILFIHIGTAIIWVGGILFVGWAIFPMVKKLTNSTKRLILQLLMKQTHIYFTIAGIIVILTGILLGTIYGPIHSLHYLITTSYGIKFSLAFSLGVIALLWGSIIAYRYTMNILQNDYLWEESLPNHHKLNRLFFRIGCIESVEIGCFIILLFIMINMY